ncbi:MAG: OprD family outer membrane porin [Sulfurospirillaceae bacterium]|nr:OprD family outer membrane porin [Sulfurospirillaceae bacterium]
MKLAQLSLAAIVVAGLATSSFAADTLADAFKNGKVSGELRAWYFDRDRAGSTNDADIFNTGLVLGYVTDSLYGFSFGATMQSNFAPFADADAKRVFKTDMYGSGAILSEAYIQYKFGNTVAKVGRQFITTPLVAGSGSRMIKQSFEGAVIINTDLPNTTLVAGYVDKYQQRTSTNTDATDIGNMPEFAQVGANGDGAYTLLAINKSLPGTTLTAQWAEVTDVVDDYYFEAAYAGKASNFTYGLAANYMMSDYDASGTDTAKMYGAKASIGVGDFNAYVAYSKIKDGSDLAPGLGGGAQPVFAKGYQYTAGTYTDNTKAYSLDATYNFKAISTLVGARYTEVKDGDVSTKKAYTDVYAQYTFAGALKGLGAELSYEDMSKDAEGKELWFKANYKF